MKRATYDHSVEEQEWRTRQIAHADRVEPWVRPRLERKYVGEKHPVDDFLFDYYPYSIGKLQAWHPGFDVILEGSAEEFLLNKDYIHTEAGITLNPAGIAKRKLRIDLAITILSNTAQKPPLFNCLGMHEWAMVYNIKPNDVRHASYALRLSPKEISNLVDEVGLRCTHFDAFRFFTQDSIPLNAIALTRNAQPENEQPGCVHATMDLYKYAMWAHPYLPSEFVADCFSLAREARTLDMQASPYDLRELGYEPILMETNEGRAEYIRCQQTLHQRGAVLRAELLDQLRLLTDNGMQQSV
jgi:hypothetical protein